MIIRAESREQSFFLTIRFWVLCRSPTDPEVLPRHRCPRQPSRDVAPKLLPRGLESRKYSTMKSTVVRCKTITAGIAVWDTKIETLKKYRAIKSPDGLWCDSREAKDTYVRGCLIGIYEFISMSGDYRKSVTIPGERFGICLRVVRLSQKWRLQKSLIVLIVTRISVRVTRVCVGTTQERLARR